MRDTDVLMIFMKNPIPGKVKTRLGKDIGHERAAKIYEKLLGYTCEIVQKIDSQKWVWYGDYINQDDIWSPEHFQRKLQKGNSLGDRMLGAFEEAFDHQNERVLIIGSDCPEINVKIIQEAFDSLNGSDVVIGPANDGGYYLLGMRKKVNLFEGKTWSEPSVFRETVEDVKAQGLSYKILKELTDLDTIEDLKKFPEYDTSN